jgi:hypothetical protein
MHKHTQIEWKEALLEARVPRLVALYVVLEFLSGGRNPF